MSSACPSLNPDPLATAPRELRANVFSHGWGVIVQVLVPGCEATDIRLRLSGEILTVTATLPTMERGIPLSCERGLGDAARDFALTSDLDVARLSRSLADGILTLAIPRQGVALASEEVD
jgi:HSP20 family molecular chaperone IbpA